MISVLLPSRDRPGMLAASVATLRDLADRPEQLDIRVAADNDDPATVAMAASLGVSCQTGPRYGYDRLHVYYQELAAAAIGDWLLVWNDDALMLTRGWDTALEQLPPEILVADLQSHHSPMCCFPAVRQTAVGVLGRFSSDNPHIDTFWQEVGRASGTITAVPIHVQHNQATGGPGWQQTHGFYEPAHQAELAACAVMLGLVR